MAGNLSISSTGKLCRDLFTNVCEAWRAVPSNISVDGSMNSIYFSIQQQKFSLWAKNISAFQDGHLPSSLESRIAKDPTMQRNILQVLDYLQETLESVHSILLGEIPNETWQEHSGYTYTSDIQELYLSIKDQINNLFRLSIAIRKVPETDEYTKAALRYPQFDSSGDKTHVRAKYPHAPADPWLLERLGLAITRRRQFIMYRKYHQERLEEVHSTAKRGVDGKTVWSGTKASTYMPVIDDGRDATHLIVQELSLSHSGLRPRTEYADSRIGKDGSTDKLRTPRLPLDESGHRTQYGEHFVCPYCQRPQVMPNKAEWKKHVFRDLRPYVCTDEDCDLKMFSSQHDWFDHEVKCHRKLWFCKICNDDTLFSRPTLEDHVEAVHHHTYEDGVPNAQIETWRLTRINATECPLCKSYATKLQLANQSQKCDVLLKQFQAHLGGHFEQLALAALPAELEDDLEKDLESSASSSFAQQQQTSQLYAPISAKIPRFCSVDEKYWFVIEAELENGSHWELSRFYEDFYNFHVALLTEFPAEAGNTGTQKRTLPYMPGPTNYVTDSITDGRRQNINAYVENLLMQPPYISRCQLVKQFFAPREGDFEIDPNSKEAEYRLSDRKSRGSSEGSPGIVSQQSSQENLNGNGYQGLSAAPRQSHSRGQPSISSNSGNQFRQNLSPSQPSVNSLQGGQQQPTFTIKVKIFYGEDVIAIRVPADIQYQTLHDQIRAKLKIPAGEEVILSYKDQNSGKRLALTNNNDLDYALSGNDKLMIYIEIM